MKVKNVLKAWNERISKNEELVRVCEQVKEIVGREIGIYMVLSARGTSGRTGETQK